MQVLARPPEIKREAVHASDQDQWVFTVTPISNVESSLNGTSSSDTNSESRTSFEVLNSNYVAIAFLHNGYHTVMDVLLSTCC